MNNVSLYQSAPGGYPNEAISAQLHSQLANAYASGDPRFTVKQYDRPGMSRGAAQWNQAGIDSASNLVKGVADAYSQNIQNNAYNANVALQGQQGQEQFAQALGALQQQDAYAQRLAALQQQQAAMGMYTGLLGGLLKQWQT